MSLQFFLCGELGMKQQEIVKKEIFSTHLSQKNDVSEMADCLTRCVGRPSSTRHYSKPQQRWRCRQSASSRTDAVAGNSKNSGHRRPYPDWVVHKPVERRQWDDPEVEVCLGCTIIFPHDQ